ncbi:MAG: EF-P lysine aminoacylase GenX [Gammaproteobacteria bacterium]|nr:EF-P lysine aminoacylase GenX [Gammaproteobacteria bacterium]
MSGDTASDWAPTASFDVLRLRARLLGRVREHFAATGALEVETPVMVIAGVTDVHLESLEVHRADGSRAGFLHTSPEYAMKRLLAAGSPDIYQVARVFREGERGRRHNPEFTMVEWYRLGLDHHALMDDVERLLRALIEPHRNVGPTRRVTYAAAFQETLGIDPLSTTTAELRSAMVALGADVPDSIAHEHDALLDLAMATLVAARFPADRITFLYDFPASQAALAQVRGPVASRFEAFWGPLELANGFHELGDAAEQASRFAADRRERARLGRPDRTPDRRFLAALAAGLPPCAGVALGFDRVVMIASNAATSDEVIAFAVERA